MKLFDIHTPNLSHILLWKIEEDANFYLQYLKLTPYDIAEIDKFLIEKRKLQWYASRYTLKQMLDTDEIVHLLKNEQGKPFILDSHLQLSLSHTNTITAAMTNPSLKVGIDVEQINEKVKRVANKFTTDIETAKMTVENEIAYLITIWSAKESLYKLYGNKRLDFRDHILLKSFELGEKGVIQGSIEKDNFKKSLTVYYQILDDHVLTYVEDMDK
jgi:phosphopantetheinyl transferase